VFKALIFKRLANIRRLSGLPDDGMIDGTACMLIPYDSRFTLVCNPDRFHLISADIIFGQHAGDDRQHGTPDLVGIMFDPAGVRKILFEFLLARWDDIAVFIEKNSPGARRSLID